MCVIFPQIRENSASKDNVNVYDGIPHASMIFFHQYVRSKIYCLKSQYMQSRCHCTAIKITQLYTCRPEWSLVSPYKSPITLR